MHHRSLLGAVLIGSLAALPGCSWFDSSSGSGTPGIALAPALDRDALARIGYRPEWTAYAPVSDGAELAHFDVLDDALIAQDSASVLSLLSPVSGEVRWSNPLASSLTRFVGVVRDRATIIACSESDAYFVDAGTGALTSRQHFSRVVNTPPAQDGGVLIFGTAGNMAFAHNTANGFPAWLYGVDGPVDVAPARLNDNATCIVTQNGEVLFADPRTGSGLGRARIFAAPGTPLGHSPSAVYIAGSDQSLWAFAPGHDRPLWRVRTDAPLRSPPVVAGPNVICTIPSSGLTAFDAATGKQVWSAGTVDGVVIAKRADTLLVWNGRVATLVDAARGDVIARAELPQVVRLHPASFDGSVVYAVARSGAIYKLAAR